MTGITIALWQHVTLVTELSALFRVWRPLAPAGEVQQDPGHYCWMSLPTEDILMIWQRKHVLRLGTHPVKNFWLIQTSDLYRGVP